MYKRQVFQWYNNRDDSRHCWLPPLQKALMGAFAVHWNFINPFDFDNYIDYYHRQRGEPQLIPSYPYPRGCKLGDGSTTACCAYNPTPAKVKACASYGLRMGDWGPRGRQHGTCRGSGGLGTHRGRGQGRLGSGRRGASRG